MTALQVVAEANPKTLLVWFHVMLLATLLTYLWCDRRGRRAGIEAGGMLTDFVGTVVHDRPKPYFDYRCIDALYGAHLIPNVAWVAASESLARLVCLPSPRRHDRGVSLGVLRG